MFCEMQQYNGVIFTKIFRAKQAQIINRLRNLKRNTNIPVYFISSYIQINILLYSMGENRNISLNMFYDLIL
jgi:hypothetical protein